MNKGVCYRTSSLPPFDAYFQSGSEVGIRTTVCHPTSGKRHGVEIKHEGDQIVVYAPAYAFRAISKVIRAPLDEWYDLQQHINNSVS